MTDSFSSLIDFDAISFAKGILTEVENIRSYKVGKSDSTGETTQVPSESRLNAFYRLMGFPMFVTLKGKNGVKLSNELSNVNHLTPGWVAHFDGSSHPLITGNVSVEDSKDVSGLTVTSGKGENTNLKSFLQSREGTLADMENSVGNTVMNNRMIAAFHKPMGITMHDKSSTTFIGSTYETNINKQRYRFKKLTPFVTMAGSKKLDAEHVLWDIYPKSNMLSKPFVLNPSLQKVDSQTALKRPFIESVIRMRMVNMKSSASTTYYEQTKENLKKQKINLPNSGTLLEAFIINKLLLSLKQLAKKWNQLNLRRQSILKKSLIEFKVESNLAKADPSGKRSFKVPTVSAQAGTELGAQLLKIKQNIAELEALTSLLPTDDSQVTEKKGTGTILVSNISANALTSPFLEILNSDLAFYKKELAKVQRKMQDSAAEADRVRYELEIMTGEFLGISICDIICIIIGMFVVDKNYLIALLDDYVKADMSKDPTFDTILTGPTNITAGEALTKLEEAVKSVYVLLEKEIVAFSDKSKRTKDTDTKNNTTKAKVADKTSKLPTIDDLLNGSLKKES